MSITHDNETQPAPTNWDGTPMDVISVRARKLYGDPLSVEIRQRGDVVAWQTAGPRGGLSEVVTMTPDGARAAANALLHYAAQAEGEGHG